MGSACARPRRTSHLARPSRQRWRPRPRLNPPWPLPALRWEERLITVLGVRLDAPEGTASFQLTSVLETLMGKVTSFGARIEDLTPVGLVAVFGIDAMEDGPRRAVHAARAMIRALRAGDDPGLGGLTARCAVHLGRYLMATGGAAPGLDARARREAWTTVTALLEQVRPNGVVLDAAAARLVERRFGLEPTGHDVVPGYRVMVGSRASGIRRGRAHPDAPGGAGPRAGAAPPSAGPSRRRPRPGRGDRRGARRRQVPAGLGGHADASRSWLAHRARQRGLVRPGDAVSARDRPAQGLFPRRGPRRPAADSREGDGQNPGARSRPGAEPRRAPRSARRAGGGRSLGETGPATAAAADAGCDRSGSGSTRRGSSPCCS